MNTWWNRNGGISGIAGFLVILAIVLIVKYWYVIVPMVAFGGLMVLIGWAIYWLSEWAAEDAKKKAAIIARAESQHARLMDGDELYGVHGNYPPVNLHVDLKLKQ